MVHCWVPDTKIVFRSQHVSRGCSPSRSMLLPTESSEQPLGVLLGTEFSLTVEKPVPTGLSAIK